MEEGQIVIRLDDTVPRANLGVVRSQLDELTARQARLTAERDNAEVVSFPGGADRPRRRNPGRDRRSSASRSCSSSRRQSRLGQRALLQERVAQINEEVRGLTSQRKAKEGEIGLIGEELKGVSELYAKNLVSIMRYMALQRDQAKLEGEHGQLGAEIARARGTHQRDRAADHPAREGFHAPRC